MEQNDDDEDDDDDDDDDDDYDDDDDKHRCLFCSVLWTFVQQQISVFSHSKLYGDFRGF